MHGEKVKSLWDIRIFLGLVPKELHCIMICMHNEKFSFLQE
jgi:hypothetical protein